MTTKLLKHLLIFCVLLIAQISTAQQPAFISDSLDTYIEREMKDWRIPALAVAIVKDGKIVHLKGYGTKSVDSDDAVDENTLFMIGSNSKLFTATALAILEQDKKLSLDDKAKKWLPYFNLKDNSTGSAVTIKDLLSHRIGFESYKGDFTYWCSNLTREEIVRKMAIADLAYDFRTTWGYCNAAFVASGEVVEAVSGEKWETFVKKNILSPLRMNSTLMLAREISDAKNIAFPHTDIDGKMTKIDFPMIDNMAPAGSMSSNVKDMANWLIAQLQSGKFEGKQLISKDAILATRQLQTVKQFDQEKEKYTHFYMYGLGLTVQDRDNRIEFGHTGGVDGFTSSVSFIPEEQLGVVVLTNTNSNSLFRILNRQIVDAYLGIPYENYSTKALKTSRENAAKKKARIDSLRAVVAQRNKMDLPLEKFTGDYTHELYGDIFIEAKKGDLIIHFSNHPNLTAKLQHLKDNTFLCDYSIPTYGSALEFPFVIKDGKVTGFTLSADHFVEISTYDFTKK
ncbi:serine hydrolase [Sinomicrobium sp.]